MVWVALAGPGSNSAVAFAWHAADIVLTGTGVTEPLFLQYVLRRLDGQYSDVCA